MTIYDEYVSYTAQYKKEYGELTLVLIEVGSFWEMYNCDCNLGADMKTISDLLNIQVSKKNKSIVAVSAQNPLMAGFPSHVLDRFLPILLENQYTVVLVSQVTPPPNPKRSVTHVLSKATYIEGLMQQNADQGKQQSDTNIMCIYLRKYSDVRSRANGCALGLSIIDMASGKCRVYEGAYTNDYASAIGNCLQHYIFAYNPCELILFGDSTAYMNAKQLALSLGLASEFTKVIDHFDTYDREVHKLDYQNALTARVFPEASMHMMTPIEWVSLENRYDALQSYVYLLRYIVRHNEQIIICLERPVILDDKRHLKLSLNTGRQLDLSGLEKIINRCRTSFGRRYFRHRLYNPLVDVASLIEAYDIIEQYRALGAICIKQVSMFLKDMYDLEKLFRKWTIGRLQPSEIVWVMESLSLAAKICQLLVDEHHFESLTPINAHIAALQYDVTQSLEMDECQKYNMESIRTNIFKRGVHQDIDELHDNINECDHILACLITELNNAYGDGYFRLESNDRDGFYLLITTKRYNEVSKNIRDVTKIGQYTFDVRQMQQTKVQNTYLKLTCASSLSQIYNKKVTLTDGLQKLTCARYQDWLMHMAKKFHEQFMSIVQSMTIVDYNTTCALNSFEFCYARPCIPSPSSPSSCSFSSIRHPIIEQCNKHIDYVRNDLSVESKGILLYGLNAAGKSSLMKAVGLNIILAQAGMYVAADALMLTPYQSIFSRISRHDDLYRGQSTFMVEMSELRDILKYADSTSLVLADELCSGTESTSATAIVAATIQELCKRSISFVFTTHLHELTQLDDVRKCIHDKQLRVCHLHVEVDPVTKVLIYDRRLKDGQGSEMYGLEVCKALELGDEFLRLAFSIRDTILTKQTQHGIDLQSSRYNTSMYKSNVCEVCRQPVSNSAVEVHHIRQQAHADANWRTIDRVHVNTVSNLVTLCETCHDNVHNGTVKINGFKQTSQGRQLMYEHNTQKQKENELHDEAIRHVIQTLKNDMSRTKRITIKEIQAYIAKHHDIECSTYKIKKLMS
jgi:DNA mismatch repair protein MutS